MSPEYIALLCFLIFSVCLATLFYLAGYAVGYLGMANREKEESRVFRWSYRIGYEAGARAREKLYAQQSRDDSQEKS